MRSLLSFLALVWLAGCRQASTSLPSIDPPAPPWFEDVTERLGLNFVHDPGPLPGDNYFMPQIVGSGAAVFDFDNDGRLDVYLLQNAGPASRTPNRLFRQEPDGRFRDVSDGSGLDVSGHGMGVAIGDINNDGLPDVCLTEYGRSRLFLNQGAGRFLDCTKEAGLDNPLWGASASFFDFDRDGWLDLVLVNYLDYDPTKPCGSDGGKRDYCGPSAFSGTVSKLYRNRGDKKKVSFEDVSLASGIGRLPGPGFGVVCADFNGDRWPDILIANDGKPNHLWIHQRDGTFKEEAVLRGIAYNSLGQTAGNMGIALGDVNGDGLQDVFVTHLTWENHTLWKQSTRGLFQDRTAAAGLSGSHWRSTGWGTVLADFNQDGALDLAVVNGRISRSEEAVRTAKAFWDPYKERNQLFANDGTGRFSDLSLQESAFCGNGVVARGLAFGDLDSDGAVDLLVNCIGAPARLYRNVTPQRGHWLLVRATDPSLGGRDAYGAEITVVAEQRRWLRLVQPGTSFCSSNDPRVHVGLGRVARVDAIRVVWPDGSEEEFPGESADRVLELRKGGGKRVPSP